MGGGPPGESTILVRHLHRGDLGRRQRAEGDVAHEARRVVTGEAERLASAYRASLALAREYQIESVAFPAISTGIYGYPLPAATDIAVAVIREALDAPGRLSRVVFACFNDEVLRAYRSAGVPPR